MSSQIVQQIIESGSLIVIAFGGLIYFSRAMTYRGRIQTEISLLRDCYYYRRVVEKYREIEPGDSPQGYREIRSQVEDELGYSHSQLSEPARIRKRLESLRRHDKSISDFVDRIRVG